MDQRALNSVEWENPSNWTGPKWLSLYSSKEDTRLWVPKQIPALGWTINFGHPRGKPCLIAVLLAAVGFVVISNVIVLKLVTQ
jgi:uncharacterized membrane protein